MQYTVNGKIINIEHMTPEESSNIEKETKNSIAKCNINSDEIDEYYNLLKNSSVDEKDSEKFGNFMKLLDKISQIENEDTSTCMSITIDEYFIKVPPPPVEGRKDIIETGTVISSSVEKEESGGGIDIRFIILLAIFLVFCFCKK